MPNIKFLSGLSTKIDNVSTVPGQLLFTTDTGHIFYDTDGTKSGRKELYLDVINNLTALSEKVGDKTVATQIQEAIAELVNPDGTIKGVTAISPGNGIVVDSTTNASMPKVSVKIADGDNALTLDENGGLKVDPTVLTDYTVSVTETAGSDGSDISKSYKFTQDGKDIVTINIPKDQVVSSGEIVVDPEGQDPGTYIVLTLANATNDKLYINVGDLVDEVTAKNAEGAQVEISVANGSEISATLSAATVASIAKADTAVQRTDITGVEATAGKYISGVSIDAETHAITFTTDSIDEYQGLQWGTFPDTAEGE